MLLHLLARYHLLWHVLFLIQLVRCVFTNSNNNNNKMPHTMIADSTEHGNGEWQEEPKNRTENQMRRKKSTHTHSTRIEWKPTNHYMALLPVVMNIKVKFCCCFIFIQWDTLDKNQVIDKWKDGCSRQSERREKKYPV